MTAAGVGQPVSETCADLGDQRQATRTWDSVRIQAWRHPNCHMFTRGVHRYLAYVPRGAGIRLTVLLRAEQGTILRKMKLSLRHI